VEAYLPERGWIRFDPTPPSSAEPQVTSRGALGLVRDLIEAASQTWRHSVEGYDQNQQVSILRSVRDFFRSATPSSSRDASAKFNLKRWGLALGGVALLVAAAILFLRRRPVVSNPHQPSAPSIARSIELYLRLERALEVRGVPRPTSTPPLTHAKSLCAAGHPTGPEVLALTEMYIGARFLDRPLSEAEVRDFQERVTRLRRASLADQSTDQAAA
jgi:hypothetical protein